MSPNDSSPLSSATVAVDYDPFAGSALERVVPATAPQREVWLAATLEPAASLAYNESASLRLHGELNVPALQAALQQLMDRHEALRATFSQDGEELYIASQQALPCPVRDLSWLGVDEGDADIEATLHRAVTTPFDLEKGPLLRAELLELDSQDHLLVLTAHHIVCDGWSFGVIARDLAALYANQLGAGDALPPADAFADYALAEANHTQSEEGRDAEAYWLGRFADATPSLDLPTDHARPRQRSFTSRREDLTLDGKLIADVKRMGASQGASLYATLLCAFGLLLQRLSGQDDVVIGIPSAGQAAGGHDALVGHCVNVLPLRVAIDPAAPFAQSLKQVRGDLLDAFDHQQYTIGSLLARLALPRDPGRLPLVSVLFNLDQALDERTVSFPGLSFEFGGNPRAFENFELFVNAVQLPDGLRLECQYNTDLFAQDTIKAWLDAYATLLRSAASSSDAAGSALALVSDAAAARLQSLQPARTPYPSQQLAHQYVEAQVDRVPTRVAIASGEAPWTYAQLEARANRIAHVLRDRGVSHGSLVGLSLARGPDMVAALLGVLKSGAGYVPLDPSFPPERLSFMAEDAALAALIVDDEALSALAFDADKVLSLRRDAALIDAANADRLPHDERSATPESVAYLIYTSGSTGKPKGVRVPHRATANFLSSMQREPGITESDRLVAVTTLSFDIAFLELMLPLSVGAAIVLASYDDVRDGAALRRLVEQSDATMMQATPAGWRILLESGWPGRARFKGLAGGEPLPLDLAETLLSLCGELWNVYGPTETTVWSTLWQVTHPRDGISIGHPIANTTVYILDEHGALCPLGMPGEMYIGGDGVTLGYLNRPELNAERFLPDPFVGGTARMYRTGDRGRWMANGLLEHRGRLDFQVKIRGYRIELGEIETALTDLPEVARAVVVAREARPGDVRLVAYVVPRPGADLEHTDLCPPLRQRLPEYMVPQHMMALAAIPLLPNGKIDRKSLPVPPVSSVATNRERQAPQSETERRVAAAMETVLALPDLDVRDNFFALGGHSLLAAQLTARLNREFDIALSFRTLFDAPSIASLAATIDEQLAAGAVAAPPPILRREQQHRAPLSYMQRRLWDLEELQPGRVTYNEPSAHRLRGHLDEQAFQRAFDELMRRQPIMRTAFRLIDGEPEQVVEDLTLPLFPAEDLSGLPDDERDAALMECLQTLTDTPFELTRAPLFSARMFRLGPDDHVFFFMPHHIIWDGWSFDILYAELSQLYKAFAQQQPSPLPALPVSYGDFAAWHAQWLESEGFQAQLDYWRKRLADSPEARALPTDHPRRPGMSGVGRTEWIRMPKDATDALHAVAKQADATLNMLMLSLYYVLLSGMSGQRHLVVGTPVRARNQTEVEQVMGYFNNLLPLHLTVEPSTRFIDFVRQVKDAAIESFGHPDVPLEYLQRELHASNGAVLYHALFSFQDARQRAVDWGGLSHEQILLFQSGATEDLGLWFLENSKGLLGGVTYNADILQASTARLQRDRYLALAARIVADPNQTLATLNAIDADELARVRQWNAHAATNAEDIVARFEACAAQASTQAAIHADGQDTSYATLDAQSNRVAACLRQRGVAAGTAVGLCVASGAAWIASLLGILKAGGAAVLLDPAQPSADLLDILKDAQARVLIGQASLEASLGWPHSRALWLDADAAEIASAQATRVEGEAPSPDQLGLVSYGTERDGRPSGHAFSRRALALQLSGMHEVLAVAAGDNVLGSAPVDTGRAVLEALLPLTVGGRYVPAALNQLKDATTFARLLKESDVHVAFAPDAAWQALLASGWVGNAATKAVVVDSLPTPELAGALQARSAGVYALSGSDDVALAVTAGRVEQPADGVHAGRPLAGAALWILDANQQPSPIGAIGDIHLGGDVLAAPFGQRAEAHRHITLPDTTDVRNTGLRGRWLADGQVQVTGRTDGRAPLNAHLFEPATLQRALKAQATHSAAADVQTHAMTPSEQQLATLWQELLRISQVRSSDNFFDIGGHSLLAVEMAARVQRETGVRLNLLDIANGTLATLAAELAAAPPASEERPSALGQRLRKLFGKR